MGAAPRIVIVGGGIAGVCLAWALAQRGRGRGVTLLEGERALGTHSTGKNAAILRTAIDAPATRALALESARFLRRPPAGFAPVPLLDEVGLVLAEGTAGEREPAWLEDHRALDAVEPLSDADLARRAPHLAPSGARRWWFPRQGRIDVSALLDAFAAGARRGGVALRTGAHVEGVLPEEGVVLLAGGERLAADVVVVAAGGWAGGLAAGAASAGLTPTRRHLTVSTLDGRVDARWPVVWDDVAGLYARPESGGLLVCACDQSVADPEDPEHCHVDRDVLLSVAAKVARLLPTFADARVAHFWAGVRTLTPDDTPLVGFDPERAGLFWMAGLGGHGIGVSAAVGRVAAALLCGEEPPLADALHPGRFGAAVG